MSAYNTATLEYYFIFKTISRAKFNLVFFFDRNYLKIIFFFPCFFYMRKLVINVYS